MGGLSDQLLSVGCVQHVEFLHGEQVQILTGPDAGKFFGATLEAEPSAVLDAELGPDVRSKWVIHFDTTKLLPNLRSQDRLKDSNGKVWKVVTYQPGSYLTTDFEIIEVVPGVDT